MLPPALAGAIVIVDVERPSEEPLLESTPVIVTVMGSPQAVFTSEVLHTVSGSAKFVFFAVGHEVVRLAHRGAGESERRSCPEAGAMHGKRGRTQLYGMMTPSAGSRMHGPPDDEAEPEKNVAALAGAGSTPVSGFVSMNGSDGKSPQPDVQARAFALHMAVGPPPLLPNEPLLPPDVSDEEPSGASWWPCVAHDDAPSVAATTSARDAAPTAAHVRKRAGRLKLSRCGMPDPTYAVRRSPRRPR